MYFLFSYISCFFLNIWGMVKPCNHLILLFANFYYLELIRFFIFPSLQSFTRLAELVLQANKKDLDLLGGSMNDEFNLADLEEQEGLCNVSDGTRKSCWCWGQEVTWLLIRLISIFMLHLHFEYHFAKLTVIVKQCLVPLMAYFLPILMNIICFIVTTN